MSDLAENEGRAVEATRDLITIGTLERDLRALGLRAGMTVLVHSALSKLGWVCGGPAAVILALENVLTPAGTLVMPAHSTDNSDPARWQHPPVPQAWWEGIRTEMPAYRPDLTPTRGMGRIAETFRKQDGVLRSAHPQVSFAAWGAGAEFVTAGHALTESLGETSPLARVYDLDGHILLLGVDHGNNTSLHLAEYRSDWPGKEPIRQGAAMLVDGQREWVWYEDVDSDGEDFAKLGADFAATGLQIEGMVGLGKALFMKQRAIVDYGLKWLEANR